MSPSHLALLGVFGSELQLERLRIFLLGEMGSSVEESRCFLRYDPRIARGEVARDWRVGDGSTSSGLNSGSSAKRSSKSTSDRTLSTESNVFFKGGGRNLGFFTGASFLSATSEGGPADRPASPGDPLTLVEAADATGEEGGAEAESGRLSDIVAFHSVGYTDSFLTVGDCGGSLFTSDIKEAPPCRGDPTDFSSVTLLAHMSREDRSSEAVSLGFPGASSRGGAAEKELDEADDCSVDVSWTMDVPRDSVVYFCSGVSSRAGKGAGRGVERTQGEGEVASYDPTGILAMVAFTFWRGFGRFRCGLGVTRLNVTEEAVTVVTCEVLPPVDVALIVGGDVTALGSMVVGAVGTTPVLATVYTRFCAGAAGTASVLDPTEG